MRSKLSKLKSIIDSTIDLALRRSRGWIDLKINAITGGPLALEHQGVYSWIQGRGLEALTEHIRWYSSLGASSPVGSSGEAPGGPGEGASGGAKVPDLDGMRRLASSVAAKLAARRRTGRHFRFLLDKQYEDTPFYTMSDIFCSKGLYDYHSLFGTEEDRAESRAFLLDVVDGVLRGDFQNDQEGFKNSQFSGAADGKDKGESFASRMIAIGSVSLLLQNEPERDYVKLGRELISHIVRNYKFDDVLVDSIKDGKPFEEDGAAVVDPGHSIECAGLALTFIDKCKNLDCVDGSDRLWLEDATAQMAAILKASLDLGYIQGAGIAKHVDLKTGRILKDELPWWPLPEAMRALSFVKEAWAAQLFDACFEDFVKNYYEPSKVGIAIQTIDSARRPIDVIPATPDLDPGYHTGLCFIRCCKALSEEKTREGAWQP